MQIFADKKFENPIKVIKAFDNKSFIEAFSQIEELRKNKYLLGYVRYEAKEIFLGKTIKTKTPLLYFEVFDKYEPFRSESSNDFILNPIAQISYEDYKKAIERIKEEISLGNTYQVNYTYEYKIKTDVDIDGFELYNSILKCQTTPYNFYMKNQWEEILSFSPELFFEIENNIIKTKPMKGTIKRGQTPQEDLTNIKFLKNNTKNRAENTMIVDLLRNDLGKIAKTGTIKVDKLFEIETHKTLHQMTSEVTAEIDSSMTLYDVFDAIFPCGSVTGAPKINTMEIIDKLEQGQRGIYCGAIGLISPQKIVFSVPIRILQKKAEENSFSCRVGGAIVWDSTPEEEWDETLTKIKFLMPDSEVESKFDVDSKNKLDFKLVETIKVENGKMIYEKEHFDRMKKSAEKLGFELDSLRLATTLTLIAQKEKEQLYILRILLSKDGSFETESLPFIKPKTNKIIVSKIPVNSNESHLYYKTTYRPWYDSSLEKIRSGEIYDEIFFNEKGELTEGARSNIILQIDGKLFTPPIECGLLNGILRQEMLNENLIIERKLYLEDLKRAEKIYCINSVRGMVEVQCEFN